MIRLSLISALVVCTAAAPAHAAAPAVRPGKYECWAWSQPRLLMNFTVTGPGTYRKTSGAGSFKVGPDGTLAVKGPMLDAMPKGFVAVYHEKHGKPTVSFRGPSGSEAAFCERVS